MVRDGGRTKRLRKKKRETAGWGGRDSDKDLSMERRARGTISVI